MLEMPSSCNLMGGNPPILGGSSSGIEIALRGLTMGIFGGGGLRGGRFCWLRTEDSTQTKSAQRQSSL